MSRRPEAGTGGEPGAVPGPGVGPGAGRMLTRGGATVNREPIEVAPADGERWSTGANREASVAGADWPRGMWARG
ncbi:hypothetical protein, partial [Nocardioides sp.]|uniref:hypothetical protein n=1 Tax=Nocardioides sp. TaxID=35761 RepID=UPI00356442FE